MSGLADEDRIFVALASYCEPELRLTIEDCRAKARHPERLTFGVCHQYDDGGDPEIRADCIDDLAGEDWLSIIRFDHRDGRGGCWARHLTQGLYRGEDYTLQVDSHSRFGPDWDTELLRMATDFPSDKPLITGFPPLYHRADDTDYFPDDHDPDAVPVTVVEYWSEDGWIHHPTRMILEHTQMPRRTRVLSGAFVFTLGVWNHEVRQDPEHIYTGEEFALTIRSFTAGYDLFNPDRCVVFHRGHIGEEPRRYIDEFEDDIVSRRHSKAMKRLRTLLRGDPQRILAPYSLGEARTLEELRVFSGLDCDTYTVHEDAHTGVPPDPVTIKEPSSPA